jgi:hypothetical protein
MFRLPVSLLTAFTALAAVAAILTADPDQAAPAAARNVVSSDDPNVDKLNLRTYHFAARIAYKDSLIRELVAGRATLAQVSDEFLRLNEEEPASLEVLRRCYPGPGDEERSAHNVLGYVLRFQLPADEAARVLDRLGREFAERFGHPPATDL